MILYDRRAPSRSRSLTGIRARLPRASQIGFVPSAKARHHTPRIAGGLGRVTPDALADLPALRQRRPLALVVEGAPPRDDTRHVRTILLRLRSAPHARRTVIQWSTCGRREPRLHRRAAVSSLACATTLARRRRRHRLSQPMPRRSRGGRGGGLARLVARVLPAGTWCASRAPRREVCDGGRIHPLIPTVE